MQEDELITRKAGPVFLRRVRWRYSLFTRLLLSFLLAVAMAVTLSSALIVLAHRYVLAPYISDTVAEQVASLLFSQVLLIQLFVILTTVLVSYLFVRNLSRPIQQLISAMREAAKGNLKVRISSVRRDELGLLITFFNGMMSRLQEARERDHHISELKSRFISTFAHQLRTPLTSLNWSLQYLLGEKSGKLSDKQREVLMQEQEISRQLIRRVSQMLDVSQTEEGKFVINFAEIALPQLVKQVVEEFSTQAATRKITLTFQQKVADDLHINADETHLRTAIETLIDNALRYSKAGSTVTVRLLTEDGAVKLLVIDHGIGIPRKEQNKIFSRFYRASNAMLVQQDGNGLGLNIARNVARRHGGDITFTSEENKGSVFVISLPLH